MWEGLFLICTLNMEDPVLQSFIYVTHPYSCCIWLLLLWLQILSWITLHKYRLQNWACAWIVFRRYCAMLINRFKQIQTVTVTGFQKGRIGLFHICCMFFKFPSFIIQVSLFPPSPHLRWITNSNYYYYHHNDSYHC